MKNPVGRAAAPIGGAQCAPYPSTGETPVPPIHQNFLMQ